MLWWVMLAGGLGSGARYLIGEWAISALATTFPYGTLIVNLGGCLALGFLTQLHATGVVSAEMRVAIGVGFLGGFTTYSSFNQETLMLMSHGSSGAAFLNIAVTLLGGITAGLLGMAIGRAIA